MAGSDREKGAEKPSEQRGGTTPDEAEAREMLEEDRQLRSSVLGETTGSDEPATESGVDLSGGDNADAVTDAGPDLPEDAEPDLKDAAAAAPQADLDSDR